MRRTKSVILKYIRPVILVVVFTIVGVGTILATRAATPTVNIEPEAGVVVGPAVACKDGTASGVGCVQFGGAIAAADYICSQLAPTDTNVINGYCVPFDALSPWNTPIPSDITVDPNSAMYMSDIARSGKPLTSDRDQYSISLYSVDATTPKRTVYLECYYSTYDSGDSSRVGHGCPAGDVTNVPIPDGAVASPGSDGQILFWDPVGGTEWAFWRFRDDGSGGYIAQNGWRYHTTNGYYGRFADGLSGRGAGTPYSAGLVRKWEIDQGSIKHALAFACSGPAGPFVYPASKSDGANFIKPDGCTSLPEGQRIQLDPSYTDTDFDSWGLSPEAKVIAKALQEYGMYVIDNSGSSKVYLEAQETANWGPEVNRDMLSSIPWSAFRAVIPPTPPN